MNPDDPVCLCFHVTRRKVINFIRVEKPKRPSQLSECFGAGTGCGWCRRYLERMLQDELAKQQNDSSKYSSTPALDGREKLAEDVPELEELTMEEYKKARSKYVREGGGSPPPGATPIDP